MIIRYKKKRTRFLLIMIVLWFVLLIANLLFNEFNKWSQSIGIILPLLFITTYAYQYLNQYLTIENELIYLNSPFSKKMELKEIKNIKKFAGEYILKSDEKELRIDTTLIDQESLTYLNEKLKSLNFNF
jgi:predicted membrane protein